MDGKSTVLNTDNQNADFQKEDKRTKLVVQIENAFAPEMMYEREKQLITALSDCAGAYYDFNITKNRIVGTPIQIIEGKPYSIHQQIGMPEHCPFTDIIHYWGDKLDPEEQPAFFEFFDRKHFVDCFARGQNLVRHTYWTKTVLGEPMLAEQRVLLYKDITTGDLMGLTYVLDQMELNKATESATLFKKDFLFQMSHDIRTPMNAILGFVNLIKSSKDIDVIHNDYVPKLEIAGEQLMMLLNDTLEMSRIESGKLEFRRSTHNIRRVIANVLMVMQTRAEEKGVELTADISVSHPMVNCDHNHLSRMVMNLLSNAVKFTPEGGKVTVSLYEKPGAPEGHIAFELKVADTGIGMSPEFVEKAFVPFEREHTSTASGVQGTGLGLAIVKRIVDAIGADISVESKQGVGTVFTLNFTAQCAKEAELQEIQEEENKTPPMEQMADYFKGKRILLVEDNEFNLAIAEAILENAGFSVETATDGQMAVDKVIAAPAPNYYDVILMDVQMPVMNGYEATRTIRALTDGREQTKIIAVTANAFDTDRDDAMAAGMDEHIAKPIDINVLYRTLWDII